MATLREIRRQLRSVENIEKITQAMEMVAASRLRKAQTRAEMSRPYFLRLSKILHQLILAAHDFTHPLINKREVVNKIAFVVIAGDRGLCGAYNHNVFAIAERELKNYSSDQIELLLFGRKAVDYFSGKRWKISDKISDWGGKITYQQVEEFTSALINRYLAGEFDEVWLIYTHYINTSARKIMVEKLLNIDIEEDSTLEERDTPSSYIFEPNVAQIFAAILPRYIITKLQSALNESYASELAARIFSMRAATKNAEEMIEKLTLVRNKVRQSSITRELLEITACVESLK